MAMLKFAVILVVALLGACSVDAIAGSHCAEGNYEVCCLIPDPSGGFFGFSLTGEPNPCVCRSKNGSPIPPQYCTFSAVRQIVQKKPTGPKLGASVRVQ